MESLSTSEFYLLASAFERGSLIVEEDGSQDDRRLQPRALLRGEVMPNGPVSFVRAFGAKPKDLIQSTAKDHLLLGPNALDVLRGHGFSGWLTYPTVIRTGTSVLEAYEGLQVIGRCGPLLFDRMREELRSPEVPTGRPYRVFVGLEFEPATWDGSDIFMPNDTTSYVLVSATVRDALRVAGISNIDLRSLSSFELLVRPTWTMS